MYNRYASGPLLQQAINRGRAAPAKHHLWPAAKHLSPHCMLRTWHACLWSPALHAPHKRSCCDGDHWPLSSRCCLRADCALGAAAWVGARDEASSRNLYTIGYRY